MKIISKVCQFRSNPSIQMSVCKKCIEAHNILHWLYPQQNFIYFLRLYCNYILPFSFLPQNPFIYPSLFNNSIVIIEILLIFYEIIFFYLFICYLFIVTYFKLSMLPPWLLICWIAERQYHTCVRSVFLNFNI